MKDESYGRDVLFIAGLPRSGTSLLYALVNQHPDIHLMFEADLMSLPGSYASYRFHAEWLDRIDFWNEALQRHGIRDQVIRHAQPPRDAHELYRFLADQKGARLCGEKSPHYFACLPRLFEHYPQAKVLIIWRDFESIYNSFCAAAETERFFRQSGSYHKYLRGYEIMLRDAQNLKERGFSIFEVDYGDLVAEPRKTMQVVADFLEIPFEEKMTSLENADLSVVPVKEHHKLLRKRKIEKVKRPNRINPETLANIQKWQHRWNRIRKNGDPGSEGVEPGRWSFVFSEVVGSYLLYWTDLKRWLYEWTPVPWLDFYRTEIVGRDESIHHEKDSRYNPKYLNQQ